jgi:hypothetical protein
VPHEFIGAVNNPTMAGHMPGLEGASVMSNNNVLAGMACPKCGSEEPISIEITMMVQYWDDGSDDYQGDMCWADTSYCQCDECYHHGTVADFTTKREQA